MNQINNKSMILIQIHFQKEMRCLNESNEVDFYSPLFQSNAVVAYVQEIELFDCIGKFEL
jgi:hypothetical protein